MYDMYPRILNPPPSITELITNREYWKKKILHYRSEKIVYDQDIRTGVCIVCKRNGKAQYSGPTYLHHLFYDDTDPLAYTIEVCGKCHYKIDLNNRKRVDRSYGKYDIKEDTMSNVSRRYW